MKRILQVIFFIFIASNAYSQTYDTIRYKKYPHFEAVLEEQSNDVWLLKNMSRGHGNTNYKMYVCSIPKSSKKIVIVHVQGKTDELTILQIDDISIKEFTLISVEKEQLEKIFPKMTISLVRQFTQGNDKYLNDALTEYLFEPFLYLLNEIQKYDIKVLFHDGVDEEFAGLFESSGTDVLKYHNTYYTLEYNEGKKKWSLKELSFLFGQSYTVNFSDAKSKNGLMNIDYNGQIIWLELTKNNYIEPLELRSKAYEGISLSERASTEEVLESDHHFERLVKFLNDQLTDFLAEYPEVEF